ncbi:MAG TPA: twin-arginine translocase subunit TatC [Bryobacteraceae bacterium]|nr:twin-arginine translocase subunit TatC [Bryobacteraceae bacterium]
MNSPEEQKGAQPPQTGTVPSAGSPAESYVDEAYPREEDFDSPDFQSAGTAAVGTAAVPEVLPPSASKGGGKNPPPPPGGSGGGGGEEGDDEEDSMLRMSFLGHLEELRSRILKALAGIGIAFAISLTFTNQLWAFVCQPAVEALKTLGYMQSLVQITPMESFNVIWVKLPILCSVFLASPWILYQVWAFISPGLYRRERRLAAPFIICSAGLFILGGTFAYFVAFRYGLTFLLSIGRGNYVTPMVSITEYFDLFVNVVVGVGLVFELPVLIFFLTLLRIISPQFLLNHSRYAILAIFVVAAIVTPTPDVFNLMLFATPMCLLFFVGIFASYLLVLRRENRRFPWRKLLSAVSIVLLLLAIVIYLAITKYGFKLVPHWPFFTH